jgi:phospholipase C
VDSIFGRLSGANKTWAIYGYDQDPYTRHDFPDTQNADPSHFGQWGDFAKAAANGLADFTFLEPGWSSKGNSQHPNYDVALGEQFIARVYNAVRNGPGWNSTLLVITYDEHGGCFDHVAPPTNATPPDESPSPSGFDFSRFGVRVPAVLVSPLIAPETILRSPTSVPFDHTSLLKTAELLWDLPPLTKRDAAAADVSGALTLANPRTDNPLSGVVAPQSTATNPAANVPSHIEQLYAQRLATLTTGGDEHAAADAISHLSTAQDYQDFISARSANWKASRGE